MNIQNYGYMENVCLPNGRVTSKFRRTKNLSLAKSKAWKSDDGNYYYWKLVPKVDFKGLQAVAVKANVIEVEK